MWSPHRVGNSVQVQPGRDGLECGISGGQLHALVLPRVQAQAGESCVSMSSFTFSQLLYIQANRVPPGAGGTVCLFMLSLMQDGEYPPALL